MIGGVSVDWAAVIVPAPVDGACLCGPVVATVSCGAVWLTDLQDLLLPRQDASPTTSTELSTVRCQLSHAVVAVGCQAPSCHAELEAWRNNGCFVAVAATGVVLTIALVTAARSGASSSASIPRLLQTLTEADK